MREIKFRCWDRNKKRFSYIQFNGNTLSWASPEYLSSEILDSEAVKFPTLLDGIQQYTGLKDRNGKEIYEGDIVHCYLEDGGAYQDLGNHAVKYEDCAFRAMYCLADMIPIIIVGNIYENHELLKEKTNV